MKALSGLQMLFGALAGVDAFILAEGKTRHIESASSQHNPMVVDFVPPSAHLELFLLVSGLIILVCALFQIKSRIKCSGWQTLLGALITLGALFFSIRASTIGHFEYSALYYAVYAFLALGVAVVVIGLLQLIKYY